MASDEKKRQRTDITARGDQASAELENLRRDTLIPQNQALWNKFLGASDVAERDYGNIMGQFQDFAKTGGFSPEDLANIRARSVSPIRAIYANANREVDRQRTLQGGYSPGFNVAKGRMAREMSQGAADASTNAEAMIAQLLQQGKLAGMQGSAGMYSATPGQAGMYGGMALDSTGQRLQGEDLQSRLSLGLLGASQNAAQLPGKWESTVGRAGQLFKMGSDVGSAVYPWLNQGKGY